jgi:hypothetical protein
MVDIVAPSAFARPTKVCEHLLSRYVARDLASKSVLFVLPVRHCLSPHTLECSVRHYHRTANYHAIVLTLEIPFEPDFGSVFVALLSTYVEG